MINYFFQAEVQDKRMIGDEELKSSPDVSTVTFISRSFMTAEAMEDAIAADFKSRLKRVGKDVEVTSIKEVSPYMMIDDDQLKAKAEEDADYAEYLDSWGGPDGESARYTFIDGSYDPDVLPMPPENFMVRYVVRSWDDFWSFDNSEYPHNASSMVH